MRQRLSSVTTRQSPDASLIHVRRLAATLVVVALAVYLAACSAVSGVSGPTGAVFNRTPPTGSNAVDTEEHSRIVAAYGGVFHDTKVEQMLVPVVSRIVASSDRPDIPYRITILNSPAINAFALPGGYLYVTRGLLALANDSSEVAAVLAHEMGHISANHAAARQALERQVLTVSNTGDASDPSSQVALAAGQRTLASFSRQQELEADAIGIRTIGKAGYDPYAAARFLTVMATYACLLYTSDAAD